MENTIKEWLRYAKDRDGGGKNGQRRKEGEEETRERERGDLGEGSD